MPQLCASNFGRASAFLASVYTQTSASWITQTGSTDDFIPAPPSTCTCFVTEPQVANGFIHVAAIPAATATFNQAAAAAVSSQFPGQYYTGFPTPRRLTQGVYFVNGQQVTEIRPVTNTTIPNLVGTKIRGGVAVVYHGLKGWWCLWFEGIPVTADEIARAQVWMQISDRVLTR